MFREWFTVRWQQMLERFKIRWQKIPAGVRYYMLLHHAAKAAYGLLLVVAVIVVCVVSADGPYTGEQLLEWMRLGVWISAGVFAVVEGWQTFQEKADRVSHLKDCASDFWAYAFQLCHLAPVVAGWDAISAPVGWWVLYMMMVYDGWAQ